VKRAAAQAALGVAIAIAPSLAHADDEVKVHVDGDPDLVVERAIEGTELWESVCVGACDRKLPLGGQYRLIGHGIRQSLPVSLVPPTHDALNLEVKAAYATGWAGGIVLVSLAAATLTVGTITFVAGATEQHFTPPCASTCPPTAPENHPATIVGATMLGVGAFMMTAGIVAIVMGSQTRVRQVDKVGVVTFTPTGVSLAF
jgi:hypothetical protein